MAVNSITVRLPGEYNRRGRTVYIRRRKEARARYSSVSSYMLYRRAIVIEIKSADVGFRHVALSLDFGTKNFVYLGAYGKYIGGRFLTKFPTDQKFRAHDRSVT